MAYYHIPDIGSNKFTIADYIYIYIFCHLAKFNSLKQVLKKPIKKGYREEAEGGWEG